MALALPVALLTSCSARDADQASAVHGPTGSDTPLRSLESYLIPPEIPTSLIDYIMKNNPDDTEILSIQVESGSDELWILQLTCERTPDESISIVKRYTRLGTEWAEV